MIRAFIIALLFVFGSTAVDAGLRQPRTKFVTCWNGTQVRYGTPCPKPPTPTPAPKDDVPLSVPTGQIEVLPALPSPWTAAQAVQPAWGTGAIPPDNGSDTVGAYRQTCGHGGLNYDDSLDYPGQPGKSHLHQYYGQTVDAFATYASMRSGKSTCANGPFPGNNSAYWMPALLDGAGNAVQPDVIPIYYKRFPKSSPQCGNPADTANRRTGICTGIPTRLNMIAGYNMHDGSWTLNERHDAGRPNGFKCNGVTGNLETLREALDACPVGGTLIIDFNFPDCFDGRRDSPNHRDHIAYGSYGDWGYYRCSPKHPYLMPQLHVAPQYKITAALKATGHLSCNPSASVSCLHMDYRENWIEGLRLAFEANDIDGHRNASGGDLGDGRQLIGAQQPLYVVNGVPTLTWTAPDEVVPVPPMPGM